MISKQLLDEKRYYTDGDTIARWDSKRRIFWFWSNKNKIRTLKYVKHAEDDLFGFQPKATVSEETIYDPIIFS